MNGLIGSTGFVGGNLARQGPFDVTCHRPDVDVIDGRSFDLLVCAGAPGEKWRANAAPEPDLANLETLMSHLDKASARRFVLISTIDVYPSPAGVDETTPIDRDAGAPYGRHRLMLEDFCTSRFARCLVVRLPALFGPGLKKNFVFDLLAGRNQHLTHHASAFQYYDVRRLWEDLRVAMDAGLTLLNVATEPLRADRIAAELTQDPFDNVTDAGPVSYDMRTIHSSVWGAEPPYLQSAGEVLERLRTWAASERASA
ncbi:MAG TPA: NAD-dependent epimerase/dehydratase family protein [Actinomycetota bacterium]|nr:NAD-dependent epimerase/dehydratase family protein [Actinomycetota bacterium]